MAILLSLCGVRVDVELEPYLPSSLHEMILGPTSALTETQFHNLRNHLEEGLHPKSVELDGFSTEQRLLGWVRSLDRLHVPHAELETWLVQREPEPLPIRSPDQASLLERIPAEIERELTALPVEPQAELEDEEEKEDTETSLQECFRLLEETFPSTEEQWLNDAGGGVEDLESQPSDRDPLLFSTDNPSMDFELHWQDLLNIMEPENTDMDMASSGHNLNSRPSGTFRGNVSGTLSNCCDNPATEADQETLLMETHLQHGLLEPLTESETVLLPLTPTAELDDHNSALNTQDTLNNIDGHPLNSPPDQTDLLAEEPLEDFSMELMEEDNIITFLSQVYVGRMEPEHLSGIDVNFQSSNSTIPLEGNVMTQDLAGSPPSHLLGYEDNEDDLPIPLSDLLEDATILDEIRLLDQALEEGFSPEMAARLEDESYFNHELAEQEISNDDDHLGSKIAVRENHGRPSTHHHGNSTDCEDELDSDSGLSLDFSHSPASPCTSEASSCSSSSTSSSFYVSATGSFFSKDDEEDSEEGLAGSDMEAVMMIKQEELEEEEMGAVGGENHENKLVPVDYSDHSLFHGFSWLEHIGHDHTYNMPWSSACSIPLGKMPTKHAKSARQHDSVKPYPQSFSRSISENKIWSRDEHRAQTLKIPFSNEVIVNLPVEDFNSLLSNYQLSEEQLTLIKDIRRRGKNKIAAQNCRKRKQDVLLGLEDDVSSLRRHRSRLLREKRETLRHLQEIRHHMEMLYKQVFSRLTSEEGSPMDATEYMLHFKPNGRNSKKQSQKDKEK